MSAPRTLWRPELFAALGAGFAGDATVQDGVHLRWFLDPRLGLPRAPRHGGFLVSYLNTKEGTIERVDLFQPSSSGYPIHSSVVNLGIGPSSLARENGSIYFTRPLQVADWSPVWRYLNHRRLIDLVRPALDADERQLLRYMDRVMEKLGVQTRGHPFLEQEDVVAVDLRFGPPPPAVPIVGTVVAEMEKLGPLPDLAIPGARISVPHRRTPGVLLDRFRPQVYASVRGYDHCDRLVAQDWVGRHPSAFFSRVTPPGFTPVTAGSWKLTARLRAPGISRVEVVRAPSRPALPEEEVRWVFCDEYATAKHLWGPQHLSMFDPSPGTYTPQMVRDVVYGPFQAASSPLDWVGLATQIRERFINDLSVQELLQTPGTFEMFRYARKLKDSVAPTGTEDDRVLLPLLTALYAAAVDPVIANILGMYYHVDDPERVSRDWRVIARPPFTQEADLRRLDEQLRALFDPGPSFFHQAGDALSSLSLAGLVLNAAISAKPSPPKPTPTTDVQTQLLPSGAGDYNLFVSAAVQANHPGFETRSYLVNTSYEVSRVLTGEATQNIVEDDAAGSLDEVGILPNVMLPEYDAETCLSKARIVDTFSRPATQKRELSYGVRGYDIFGRPSAMGASPPVHLRPPCLPPPPPTNVSSQMYANGDALLMDIAFSAGREATSVQARWDALEILVHGVPIVEGVAPEKTTWIGTRMARQLEMNFNPADRALQTTPVAESCWALQWSGSTLGRSAAAEAACSPFFAPPAEVVSEASEALPTAATGLYTYRATLRVGSIPQFPPGLNGWCARLRVRGTCAIDGSTRYSPEICTRATFRIAPPPPAVVQPPITQIPLSTYPDVFGHSYFGIDLGAFLVPADYGTRPLVKIYLARLSRLTDTPAALVQDGTLVDVGGLISLAKASKLQFALVTDPPHEFDPTRPRFDVQVPGDLEKVYVAAVTGSNVYLEEGSWQNAAFIVFRTPTPRPAPTLEWAEARPEISGSSVRSAHTLVARFRAPLPDPTQPPRVQLLRRNLSTNATHAIYLDTVTGTSPDGSAAAPVYVFAFVDDGIEDWQRYAYEAHLLEYAVHREQHVKVLAPLHRELLAPWGGTRDALAASDPMTVTSRPAGGFLIEVECSAGDFDFSLTKVLANTSRDVMRGRIERGQLQVPTGAVTATLEADVRYRLRFEDPDAAAGTYAFRLMFGQQIVWPRKTVTP